MTFISLHLKKIIINLNLKRLEDYTLKRKIDWLYLKISLQEITHKAGSEDEFAQEILYQMGKDQH